MEGAKRLRHPRGYGAGLKLVDKHLALSGALPASECDRTFAEGLVNLGVPLLMLPGNSSDVLDLPNQRTLEFIAASMSRCYATPIDEPANLISNAWFEVYSNELRARLHHLPAAYEYSVLKMARQLFPVCASKLPIGAGPAPGRAWKKSKP